MEPKKNPKYDVHKKSRMIFFLSLCLSILLVLSAFQWKSPIIKPVIEPPFADVVYDPLYPVPITEIKNTPPVVKPVKEKIIYTNPEEVKADIPDEPSINPQIELPTEPIAIPIEFIKPEAVKDTLFIVVEKMPFPENGYEGFYKFLSQELKYPKPAIKSATQGKVYVEFVVDKNGRPSNMRIIKGIGYGCDEEALRVISLTRWNAGKQRGVPVNVRMTLPIQFQLK